MSDAIEVLKRLQGIDGELFRLRRQAVEKPREIEQGEARLQAQRERLKAAEDHLRRLQLAQKEKETELQSKEADARRLQGQLFQVKTNKEYTAMQHEIEALKTDSGLLEEGLLALFDEVEGAGKERQREQAQVAAEAQRLQAERARIERELQELQARVQELERQRQAVVPDVPPDMLGAYERVLRNREGLALVPLVHESCGGCHRRLPPQVLNEVYLKARLVTCENCNRILYSDEAHSTR